MHDDMRAHRAGLRTPGAANIDAPPRLSFTATPGVLPETYQADGIGFHNIVPTHGMIFLLRPRMPPRRSRHDDSFSRSFPRRRWLALLAMMAMKPAFCHRDVIAADAAPFVKGC